MKKVISFALSFVLIISITAGLDFSVYADELSTGTCGDNVSFSFDQTSETLTISGNGSMNNYADTSKLPFYNQKCIKHVIIGRGVTSIANNAFFGCSNLEDITMPLDGNGCVNYIGRSAFEGCTSLIEFTIPFYATFVGVCAFAGCSSLTTINTLDGCQFFSSSDGILYNREKTQLYVYPAGKSATEITIRYSVEGIGESAFKGCNNLISVRFSKSLKVIKKDAFKDCLNLTNITLFDSLTNIGDNAFSGCCNLVDVSIPDSVTNLGSQAFLNCENLQTCKLSELLTSIQVGTFMNCVSLNTIRIPDSVKSLGSQAFFNCNSLSNCTLSESLNTINNSVFKGCNSLKSIVIPNGVISIGKEAFSDCISLTDLTLPISVSFYNANYNELSDCSFGESNNINIVRFTKGTNEIIDYSSRSSNSNTYHKITPWYSSTADELKLIFDSGIEQTVKDSAFLGCTNISKIYYDGTEEEWDGIDLTSYNVYLSKNKIVYTVCKKHIYDNGIYDIEPTCEEKGQITYSCTLCSQTKTERISALGHKEVVDFEIPATCTLSGLTQGIHCSVCGKVLKEQKIIPAKNHNVVVDAEIPATCTSTGLTEGSHCSECGKIFESQTVIPLIDHEIEIINNSLPTCYHDGYSGDEYCKNCQQIIKYGTVISKIERIEATGKYLLLKNYINNYGENDADGNAFIQRYDTIEGDVYLRRITYSDEYARFIFSQISSDNTVLYLTIDENGSRYALVNYKWGNLINAFCQFESDKYTKDIRLIFNQQKPENAALVLTDEQIQNVCNASLKAAFNGWDLLLLECLLFDVNMGDLGFDSYEEHGKHTWDSGTLIQKNTCTQNGIVEYKCRVCNQTRTTISSAYGHDWNDWTLVSAPKGCKDGDSIRICNRCNRIEHLAIPSTGSHNYDSGRITATTSTTYTVTYTCNICNKATYKKTFKKRNNPIKASGKTVSLKYSAVKKKNQTVKQSKAFSVSKAQGKVTYKKSSGNSKITVAKDGKITVKKGLNKGTYKVKIKVTAAGNNTYKSATKTVTVTIKIK